MVASCGMAKCTLRSEDRHRSGLDAVTYNHANTRRTTGSYPDSNTDSDADTNSIRDANANSDAWAK